MEKLEDLSPPPTPPSPPPLSLPSVPQFGSTSESDGVVFKCNGTDSASFAPEISIRPIPTGGMRVVSPSEMAWFKSRQSKKGAGRKASIFRKVFGGTSQKMKSAHGQYVLVIPRAAYQTTINEKDGERIPKEEAICRTCYKEFKEENALKVNCACPITLIHEHCAIVWSREKGSSKCDVCGQELENIPVALLPAKDAAQHPTRKLLKKWSYLFKG